MNEGEHRKTQYRTRTISILYGFILIFGLSRAGYGTAWIVAISCIVLTGMDAKTVRESKKLGVGVRWSGALCILFTSCFAYIFAEKMWMRTLLLICIGVCNYIYLYTICYPNKMSFKRIKQMICDLPVLMMFYAADFLQPDEDSERKHRNHSIVVGICLLLILLLGLILPFYIVVDARVEYILTVIISKGISEIPFCIICALIGLLPAMIKYSILKGLIFNIILSNPEREEGGEVPKNNYLFNEITTKIILAGLTVVNLLFIALQIEKIIRYKEYLTNGKYKFDMEIVLPILICVGINAAILILCGLHETEEERHKYRLSMYLHMISIFGIIILVLTNYYLKITKTGIVWFDVTGIGVSLAYLVILFTEYRCLLRYSSGFIYEMVIWGTVAIVLINLIPFEYLVSQINVKIFMSKYERGLVGDNVTKEDIDLEYLENMGWDAMPAVIQLADIEISYENTGKSLGALTEDYVLSMFYADLSPEDVSLIESVEPEEKWQILHNVLQDKMEYKIFGKKAIVLEMLW